MKKNLVSDTLKESIVLSLGAIVNTYCGYADRCQDQV